MKAYASSRFFIRSFCWKGVEGGGLMCCYRRDARHLQQAKPRAPTDSYTQYGRLLLRFIKPLLAVISYGRQACKKLKSSTDHIDTRVQDLRILGTPYVRKLLTLDKEISPLLPQSQRSSFLLNTQKTRPTPTNGYNI